MFNISRRVIVNYFKFIHSNFDQLILIYAYRISCIKNIYNIAKI